MPGQMQELAHTTKDSESIKLPFEVFSQSDDQTMHNILATVRSIENEREKADTLRNLITALAESKDSQAKVILNEVAEMVFALQDKGLREITQQDLAVAMARSGSWDQAIETARAIQEISLRAETQANVAEALARAGETERARDYLNRAFLDIEGLKDDKEYLEVLSRLAKAVTWALLENQAQVILAGALGYIGKLQREGTRAQAFVILAPYLTETLRKQALEAAQDIKSANARIRALAGLAQYHPPAKRDEIIREALRAARTIRSRAKRADMLEELAAHVAPPERMGVLQEIQALRTGEEIRTTTPDTKTGGIEPIEISTRALSDRWSETDYLGFSDYADALSDFIADERTEKPLTIAVDAAWGMGKTTLMHMIEKRLGSRSIQTVWFNAWKHNQEEALWAALALEILNQVRQRLTIEEQFKLWLKLNWKRLDRTLLLERLLKTSTYMVLVILFGAVIFGIASLWMGVNQKQTFEQLGQYLAVVGPFGILASLFSAGKEALDRITGPFDLKITEFIREPNYKERAGFIAQFEEDFKRVIDSVIQSEHGKRPLVVFIDDLDRCSPSGPVEIVEAINVLLDAQSCVFVIGMESRTVAGSIEAKYIDLKAHVDHLDDPSGLTLGQRFLEKIVQINFRIPRAAPDVIQSFIDQNLDGQADGPSGSLAQKKLAADVQAIDAQNQANIQGETDRPAQSMQPETLVAGITAQKEIRVKSFTDSEEVRNAIREAAPYLGYNPRKIKRFINLFRLQAFIASRRGLLNQHAVRLDLLAKWVVVATRWPDIVETILVGQEFIDRLLQAHAIQQKLLKSNNGTHQEKNTRANLESLLADPLIKRFIGAEELIRLLQALKCSKAEILPYLHLAQMTAG